MMPGWVAPEEQEADVFSPICEIDLNGSWIPRVCVIGDYDARTPGAAGSQVPRPTVLAVSGEEQRHVSKFFRSWRAELRGWQVLIPIRPTGHGRPYFFDADGLEPLLKLMQSLIGGSASSGLLPAPVESGQLHLVGTSNGGASVLAAACAAPHLVASLTLVTGFRPDVVRDLEPLRQLPLVRFYAGEKDELGHQRALTAVANKAGALGIRTQLRILRGATHMTIGVHVNQGQFWEELEQARRFATESAARRSSSTAKSAEPVQPGRPTPQRVLPARDVQGEYRRRTIASSF